MTDSTDDPRPINGPAIPDDDTDPGPDITEVVMTIAEALRSLDNTVDDLREGVANILQKQGHLHAMMKRQEAALTRIEKAIDGDPPDESRSGF
jgi:hypothetical protein